MLCYQGKVQLEWVCHDTKAQYSLNEYTMPPRFTTRECRVTQIQHKSNEFVMLPRFSTTRKSMSCYQSSMQIEWVSHVTMVEYNSNEYAMLQRLGV